MPHSSTSQADDDRDDEPESARFFADLPSELRPRSLDRGDFDASDTAQAQQAIQLLAHKMAETTREYADGKVNQAQFQAIYARYVEQRMSIERILDHDPDSTAWQTIIGSGSTSALRRRYAAETLGMLIIEILTGETVRILGEFDLKADLLVPILSTVIERSVRPFEAGAKSTLLEGGHWLTFIPGELTACIAIFSQEPSEQQRQGLVDLHHDFERANHAALLAGNPDASKLVYPQETLFE